MDDLKKQLDEIALSSSTYQKITSIGDKYNLLLDDQGELAAEIRNVISGIRPAKDLAKNISSRLSLDENLAAKIAGDISIEIFEPIRDKLQQIQEREVVENVPVVTPKPTPVAPAPQPPSNLSTLEKAGGFEIVKDQSIGVPQYKETNLEKNKVLEQMENPPTKVSFVDHLLAKPVSNPNQTTETPPQNPNPTPKASPPAPAKNPYTLDPYREPLE